MSLSTRVQPRAQKNGQFVHLHNNECEKKVEDFASDDVVIDPDGPLRAGDLLQILYPGSDCAEGVVLPPERTALF